MFLVEPRDVVDQTQASHLGTRPLKDSLADSVRKCALTQVRNHTIGPFEHEDDDNCDWTKLRVRERERVEGWDEETSAIQEYSNRLLQNIYLFQNLEPQMIESTPRTCRPKDVEFDDWLRKRKDRWRSERVYRKVRQLCSCTTSTRTRTTIP